MAKESSKPATTEWASPQAKKKEDATATTTTTTTSLLNTFLTCSLFLGIGAIVGYLLFYSIYNHRCSDMMDEAERRCNQTKQELNLRLIDAKGADSELLELREQLQGQADLTGKHQVLLDKHQTTLEQLQETQTKLQKVQGELTTAKTKVQELETQAKDTGGNSAACQAQQEKTMTYIQKLHSAICKEKHGQGPYYVQFDMAMDGSETESFVVEVSALDTVPHAVFSFLTLVDSGVYIGAEFLPTVSIIHLDSDEEAVAQLGYATLALSLVESVSEGSCAPYSVGFVGANGGLKIIMTNDASKHGSLACFGRIAQGRQTVSNLQRAGREGKTVAITQVTMVEMKSRPNMGEGEL